MDLFIILRDGTETGVCHLFSSQPDHKPLCGFHRVS